MEYIIIIIFLIWIFPKIFFLFSLIPINIMMLIDKRKNFHTLTIKIKDKDTIDKTTQKTNFFIRIKKFVVRYVRGYIRFSLIKTGMIPSHLIRNFLYKKIFLVEMANNVIIYYGAEIRAPYNLKIGKGSIIGDKSILDARNGIEIGENVNFSSNVSIWTQQHDHSDSYFECNSDSSFKVIIGNRAWIGPNVTILNGVFVGEGAVCAAGSVITKDVEPFTIVAGIPAKKIGDRNRNLKYIFDGKPSPFY